MNFRKVRKMPEFLTIDEVVALVPCMTKDNLATMRHNGIGPQFFKPTARTVLYDKKSVMDWLENSVVDMKQKRQVAAAKKAKKAVAA